MDKEEPHFNWWTLYKRFGNELAEITKTEYEWHRNAYTRHINKRFPKAATQNYSVNPKRFDNEVWMELLKNCYEHALHPGVALPFLRNKYAYAMPWPDRLWPTILKDSQWLETESRNGSIPYLKYLVRMADDAERRQWIETYHEKPGNPDSPAYDELFAYRIMFREYDEIRTNREETAAGLYELLNRGKLICLERNLTCNLTLFLAGTCPQSLPVPADNKP